jgi:hypothetical protein
LSVAKTSARLSITPKKIRNDQLTPFLKPCWSSTPVAPSTTIASTAGQAGSRPTRGPSRKARISSTTTAAAMASDRLIGPSTARWAWTVPRVALRGASGRRISRIAR